MSEHGRRFDTVIVSRHYIASAFLPLLRQFAPRAQILFDTVDLHYLREQREAELSGDAAQARAAAITRERELRLVRDRSEEHTSELQSLMRISYAVFCLKKQNTIKKTKPNAG